MSDPYEQIKQALRKPPTPEQIESFKKWKEDFNEYMAKPEHEGNCHCIRCLNEFSEAMRKKHAQTASE